jgi:hypothetical protein
MFMPLEAENNLKRAIGSRVRRGDERTLRQEMRYGAFAYEIGELIDRRDHSPST